LTFAASLAIILNSGLWGVGFYPETSCPSPKTAIFIILLSYLLVVAALAYAICTDSWPAIAYELLSTSSIASVLCVASHSDCRFLSFLSGPFVQFLLFVALFRSIYLLWAAIYRPIGYDWPALIARNAIAFSMGWALFLTARTLQKVVIYYSDWHSPYQKYLLWLIVLVEFAALFGTVYLRYPLDGVSSLWGSLLVLPIVFVGCWLI